MRENFTPFLLEREMGIWEHKVRYNLSESGVQPLTPRELFAGDKDLIDQFLDTRLGYIHTNGSEELRTRIAALYPGSKPEDVIVTTGAAQANFNSILTTLDAGDEIVVMVPNYLQIWGLAQNLGLRVKTFPLRHDLGWGFDPDELDRIVTNQTRLIAICNPNNPTGHIMSLEERQAVIRAAEKCGAWILADEVYAGAEHRKHAKHKKHAEHPHGAEHQKDAEHLRDESTPSFWGEYDKVLATGSMSKAYALPGLRIGWVVSNEEMANAIWARQDYVTICATMLGDRLAAYALSPEVRPRLIERTREYVRRGYKTLAQWCQENSDYFSVVPPGAAAISFVKYTPAVNSSAFVHHLVTEYDTYVAPGDHFGMDGFLRISYGLEEGFVKEGLHLIRAAFDTVPVHL